MKKVSERALSSMPFLQNFLVVGAPHMAVVAPVPPFHPGYALGAEALFTVQLGGGVMCYINWEM